MRLEEYAGLWLFTPLQRMTLEDRLNVLTIALQESLEDFPHLAGVILSPVMMWAGTASGEAVSARFERAGGITIRCPIPGHRVQEAIIVRRGGQPNTEAERFADWYQNAATWLDWALERQEFPPFDKLVQEEPLSP